MSNLTENMAQSPCPTKQMSFGDAVRYLQGGFDEPVQRAIAAHVQYCNSCQEQLEHFRALRRTGGQLLSTPHLDETTSDELLTDATLAAYLDGALPEAEHDAVTGKIASSYDTYVRFSALKADLRRPVEPGFSPPGAAVETLKIATPDDAAAIEWRTPLEVVWERLVESAQTLVAMHWPAPAAAFAVGAIVMMLLSPPSETIVAIPGLALPGASTQSEHVRSGLAETDAAAPAVDMVIKARPRQNLAFTWKPATVPVDLYSVRLVGEDGMSVIEPIVSEQPSVSIRADELEFGKPYTVSVLGAMKSGGFMPVARYTFLVEEK